MIEWNEIDLMWIFDDFLYMFRVGIIMIRICDLKNKVYKLFVMFIKRIYFFYFVENVESLCINWLK